MFKGAYVRVLKGGVSQANESRQVFKIASIEDNKSLNQRRLCTSVLRVLQSVEEGCSLKRVKDWI